MTQLKPGHIVRLPEGALGSSGLALVTKATAKAVTVTTGTLELTYEPEQLERVGVVALGETFKRIKVSPAQHFQVVYIYANYNALRHRFDIAVGGNSQPEITAVGDIRKLAFARWLEAQA